MGPLDAGELHELLAPWVDPAGLSTEGRFGQQTAGQIVVREGGPTFPRVRAKNTGPTNLGRAERRIFQAGRSPGVKDPMSQSVHTHHLAGSPS